MRPTRLFKAARFYQRVSTGAVYRCEQARDSRVLLHIADKRSWAGLEERLLLRDANESEWEQMPMEEEAHYLETYTRDLTEEYGRIDPQAALFRRQYHFDPYLKGIAEVEVRERMSAIAANFYRTDNNGAVVPALNSTYWHRVSEELLEHLQTEKQSEPPRILRRLHSLRG